MNKLTFLNKLAAALGVALALALVERVKEFMTAHELPGSVQLLVATVLVTSAAVMLRSLSEVITDTPVVRRLILGRQYVEGTWFDIVRTPGGAEWSGLVYIAPANGSVRYAGSNYLADGTPAGAFRTDWARMQFPQLVFAYENSASSGPTHSRGIGQLIFEERPDAAPVRYTGECLDVSGNVSIIEGIRIQDEELLGAFDDPWSRPDAVAKLRKAVLRIL